MVKSMRCVALSRYINSLLSSAIGMSGESRQYEYLYLIKKLGSLEDPSRPLGRESGVVLKLRMKFGMNLPPDMEWEWSELGRLMAIARDGVQIERSRMRTNRKKWTVGNET